MERFKYPEDAHEFYDIPGITNYQISRDGRVWSKKTGKFLKHILLNCGYYAVRIQDPSYKNNKLVHRLLAETFIPNPNNYRCCNHLDGNKLNNVISNIEWCSYKMNTAHAIAMGLFNPRKDFCRPKKLSRQAIADLQSKWITGAFTAQELASEFNISPRTVYRMSKVDISTLNN